MVLLAIWLFWPALFIGHKQGQAERTFTQRALVAIHSKNPHAYRALFLPPGKHDGKAERRALNYISTLRQAGLVTVDKQKDLILLTDKALAEIGKNGGNNAAK